MPVSCQNSAPNGYLKLSNIISSGMVVCFHGLREGVYMQSCRFFVGLLVSAFITVFLISPPSSG